MDLRETEAIGDPAAHWYYRSKARAVVALLDGRLSRDTTILDVGAGLGYFSSYLLENTDVAAATCVDINYDDDSDQSVRGKPLRFRREPTHEGDIVLMMDVLEHVERDDDLLSDYAAPALDGTAFLISVPAFQWLWSAHDEFLGHYRRYNLSEVEKLARGAGLRVAASTYFFASILPAAAIVRLLRRGRRPDSSDLKYSAPAVGSLLEGVLGAERRLVLGRNRLGGLTAFVLAVKPPGDAAHA